MINIELNIRIFTLFCLLSSLIFDNNEWQPELTGFKKLNLEKSRILSSFFCTADDSQYLSSLSQPAPAAEALAELYPYLVIPATRLLIGQYNRSAWYPDQWEGEIWQLSVRWQCGHSQSRQSSWTGSTSTWKWGVGCSQLQQAHRTTSTTSVLSIHTGQI